MQKGRAIAGLPSKRTQPRLFGERDGRDLHADRLADRDRGLARRRQRRRRGGCGLRRARGGRAAVDRDSAAIAFASTRLPGATKSSPSMAPAGRRRPPRSMRSRPRAPAPPDDVSPHASPFPAPSPAGNCCWTPMGPRDSTNCCLPAIRCAEEGFPVHQRVAWDWSMHEDKLRRAGKRSSCPAAARLARATGSSRPRSPARCAPSPRAALTLSTGGRSPPTWRRRFERAAACRRKRISPTDWRARSSSSRSHFNGAGSTYGSARQTGRVWSL